VKERERKIRGDGEREGGIKITVSLEGPFITGRKLALTTQFLDKTSSESPRGGGGGRNRAIGYVHSIYTVCVCVQAHANGSEVKEDLWWFTG